MLSTPTAPAAAPAVSAPASPADIAGSPLPIPTLLAPATRDGPRTFNLTPERGQMTFVPGRPVDTFGINGPYPGPTLRARQDDMVAFNVTNELGEPTTLHRHGMLLPAPVQCLTAITVALPFTSALSPAPVSVLMMVLLPEG